MTESEKLLTKAFMRRYQGNLALWEIGFVLAISDEQAAIKADINRALVESAIACGVTTNRVLAALKLAHEEDYWYGQDNVHN